MLYLATYGCNYKTHIYSTYTNKLVIASLVSCGYCRKLRTGCFGSTRSQVRILSPRSVIAMGLGYSYQLATFIVVKKWSSKVKIKNNVIRWKFIVIV